MYIFKYCSITNSHSARAYLIIMRPEDTDSDLVIMKSSINVIARLAFCNYDIVPHSLFVNVFMKKRKR